MFDRTRIVFDTYRAIENLFKKKVENLNKNLEGIEDEDTKKTIKDKINLYETLLDEIKEVTVIETRRIFAGIPDIYDVLIEIYKLLKDMKDKMFLEQGGDENDDVKQEDNN